MAKTVHGANKTPSEKPMGVEYSELSIVKQILKWLNKQPQCRAIKTFGDTKRSGEPDIYCCYQGRFVVIEVKRPGKEPTPLQYATLDMWSTSGALAFWTDSLEKVQTVIRENLIR